MEENLKIRVMIARLVVELQSVNKFSKVGDEVDVALVRFGIAY